MSRCSDASSAMRVTQFAATMDSVEALLPIAVEGEMIISWLCFLPISIMAIAAAMFARSALDGLWCACDLTACASPNGIPIHPIGLGIAAGKLRPNEKPWIGVTGHSSTSGWDHAKHYEIIAGGGLPYFVDLCALACWARARASPPKHARPIGHHGARVRAGKSARSTHSTPCPRTSSPGCASCPSSRLFKRCVS